MRFYSRASPQLV